MLRHAPAKSGPSCQKSSSRSGRWPTSPHSGFTVSSHSGHSTRGCIPRSFDSCCTTPLQKVAHHVKVIIPKEPFVSTVIIPTWPIMSNVIIPERSFGFMSPHSGLDCVKSQRSSYSRGCIPRSFGLCCVTRLPQIHGIYHSIVCILQFHKIAKGRVLQGYLTHEKQPPPQDHHRALGIFLL
jgi:hypothetical protein